MESVPLRRDADVGQPAFGGCSAYYLHVGVGEGEVHLTRWSPNVLEYDVRVDKPATLVINQNFHGPWRLQKGAGTVASHAGVLSVSVPEGSQHLVLGVFLGLLGALAAIVLYRRERKLTPPRSRC